MTKTIFNPSIHHRRSIRLKDYDYSKAGAYFATICTYKKEYLLGELNDGKIQLSDVGILVKNIWKELSKKYPNVETDEFIVMPNHIHGIIFLNVGAGLRACPDSNFPYKNGHPQGGAPTLSLPDVIQRFKSYTTSQCRKLNGHPQGGAPAFQRKLWQRNYYEHIIRKEEDLNDIREYIINNPLKWEIDSENTENTKIRRTTIK